jgi:hypothetical protein
MTRTPNRSLATLLATAGWDNGRLARAVNRTGLESGLALSYDKTAVSHWLSGTMPRPPVRPVIAEALSRRLGRPVTVAEAGFATGTAPDSAPDPVSGLLDLGRADMDPSRRGLLTAGLYSATLTVPLFTDLAKRPADPCPGRTVRIGGSEVATVRTMTERIAGILDELGAGHARPMAAAFLVNTVGPYLQANATTRVKAAMLSAASDLTYLTGWMAMYETAHGLGQRYYVKALKLAGEAQDHTTYCRTLRGMALQASNLGYGPKALELADSAAEAAPASGPRLRAFLAGQQAHGAAMVKDKRQAFSRLAETRTALSQAEGRNDAVGGYDASAYHFHVSHVLYELNDLTGSVKALQLSNRVRPAHDRQGRMHANGVLGGRQLELGHLEAACSSWNRFLDDYASLSSARGDNHFATMRAGIRPHLTNRIAKQLDDRAREMAQLKG